MGTGNNYNDFTWVDPARDTYGFVNANQTLTAIPEPGTLGALTLLAAVGLIRRRK